MEILLQIEGKVIFMQDALHVEEQSFFCFSSGSSRGTKYYSGGGGSSFSSGSGTGSRPVVYSDGCCFNNGFRGACGGLGVYWGDGST